MSEEEIISLDVQTQEESEVISWLEGVCGRPTALRTWDYYSKQFTTEENINNYFPEDFYKARADFVKYSVKKEMKQWPEH